MWAISNQEKEYLLDLAKKYMDYANNPVMEQRTKSWYNHNSLKNELPMVVMEIDTFEQDLIPKLKCTSPAAQDIEKSLLREIINYELIGDDKVIPPYYTVYWDVNIKPFNMDLKKEYSTDNSGYSIGYKQEHPIVDLHEDFHLLQRSTFHINKQKTLDYKAFIEEVFGDIMPVHIKNNSLNWHVTPSKMVVDLMGMENMLYAMMDYPEEMHELYQFIIDDIMTYAKWQESQSLLVLNNRNDYSGAGSYGFTDELPVLVKTNDSIITTKDLWVNMNSQETVGISPEMYGEFIYPYYKELAKHWGLVYYGCCEPVHTIWEDYISKLPSLRKVSISKWCDEPYMGEKLRNSNIIYSRKPDPNYVGVGTLDENAFRQHIQNTLTAAKGCTIEFIFRDIYTLNGDISKPGRAVDITRECIQKYWK